MAVFTRQRLRLSAGGTPPMRWVPGVRTSVWLWQAASAAGGALLGAGQVYGGAAPFGLAFVLGCPAGYAVAAGLGAATASLLLQPGILGIALAGSTLCAAVSRFAVKNQRVAAAVGLAVLAAMPPSFWFLRGSVTPSEVARLLCTGLLAALLGVGFAKLPLRQPKGLCLALAVAACCVQRFAAAAFAPGLALFAAAVFCCAVSGTLEQTAVLCIAFCAALTAADRAVCPAACAVALGGLAAGCLFPGDRRRCAAVFAAGCGVGALALPDVSALLPLATGAGAGLAIALALPQSLLQGLFPPPAPPLQAQPLHGAARRLAGVADTLSDIADTVTAVCDRQAPPKGETFDFVVEHIARTTCQGCTRRSQCWVRGYSTAMDGLYQLKPTLETLGKVEVENLPGQLSVCIHPGDLCLAANHGYRLWRSRRQTRARAVMLRTALTEQYSALAGALAQLSAKLSQAGLPDPRRGEKVARFFADLGLETLECCAATDLTGRLSLTVTLPRTRFTETELDDLTSEISRLCRRDMALPEVSHCRTVTTLTFSERPLFAAQFGAASRPAKGQTVSGDAFDQFCDAAGRAQMLLCDGMGTGRPAAVDGRMAAKLTAQLLRAGFAAESAARLVNVALNLKSADQESGATLDLLTVDLYTGRAGLFKAGAAPSFVVRGGTPYALEGNSLPMGVVDTLVGRSTAFSLDGGDWVVLVSDGALTDGSEWLLQQLQLCVKLGHTPDRAAETIADAAARRAGDKQDDITVEVLQLVRKGQ